ncbi:TMEM175 family protein [Flaviaesturariibacter amylovorans]|uniref:TMEM175 family protein n=1 Tax=Flaviaesturariibacter amylovorans TaxID=1084520 RepID=A0ABP8G781_9BACT
MGKGRLEAFSDGVLAIIITIMVLELKVPHGSELSDLRPLLPVFAGYLLSFVYIGIYWNNHHHLLQAAHHISGRVLWANMHLLFWLSLVPFVTAWMGEHPGSQAPVIVYGVVLLGAGLAYHWLTTALIGVHEKGSTLEQAIGRDGKGWLSLLLYVAGIGASFLNVWLSVLLYTAVAVLWFVPDTRIEGRLGKGG